MNLLGRMLDDRHARAAADEIAEDAWLRERAGVDPAQRREAWRGWLRRKLESVLVWPEDASARDRLIGQCIAEITTLCRQLRGRGWLLDGKELAEHVHELLAPIGAYQRKGKVGDFWPYFRSAVRKYVEAHADEIQAQARRSGADEASQSMAGALAALGIGRAKAKGPSLTEIVTDRDAEVRRDRAAKAEADAAQMRLL